MKTKHEKCLELASVVIKNMSKEELLDFVFYHVAEGFKEDDDRLINHMHDHITENMIDRERIRKYEKED